MFYDVLQFFSTVKTEEWRKSFKMKIKCEDCNPHREDLNVNFGW